MTDRDASDASTEAPEALEAPPEAAEAQSTSEFRAVDADLPALTRDLRDHLPGVEPERQVTDWGRSQRLEGVVDRVLLDFLYRYWFRVEVEGSENVPEEGGALLLANHAGAVPADAAMIAKALREEPPRPRTVHTSTDVSFAGVPGLGMMLTKLGGVADHPANLHRLLYDEGELVLAFPEGRVGVRKAIGRRYLLRRFEVETVEVAARARVPILPVALVGAEEASPVFARLGGALRVTRRIPRVPVSSPVPLPAKFRIRFLEPVEPEVVDGDPGALSALTAQIRGLIQENLLEMLGARRSVWLG